MYLDIVPMYKYKSLSIFEMLSVTYIFILMTEYVGVSLRVTRIIWVFYEMVVHILRLRVFASYRRIDKNAFFRQIEFKRTFKYCKYSSFCSNLDKERKETNIFLTDIFYHLLSEMYVRYKTFNKILYFSNFCVNSDRDD